MSIRKDGADIAELGEEKVWWSRGRDRNRVRVLEGLKDLFRCLRQKNPIYMYTQIDGYVCV